MGQPSILVRAFIIGIVDMRSANDECWPVIQRGASWVTGIKYVVGLFVGIRSVRICWFDIFNQLSIPLVLEPNKIKPISRERFLMLSNLFTATSFFGSQPKP
jgi:hypothetical protein